MTTKHCFITALFCALASAGTLHAQTVLISENFSGSDATNLTGKTPTTLDSSLLGETWQGPTAASDPFDFEQNGDIDASNNTTWVDVGSIINDAKGNTNGVFTLSASFTSAPVTGSWYAIGFYTTPGAAAGGNNDNEAGILFRDDGDLEGWSDNDGGAVAPDFAAGITTETISVELDLSTWNNSTDLGTITFSAGTASETHDLGQDFDWGAAGFGTSSGVTGQISSFEVTQIPEPHTGLLMLGGIGTLLLVGRRRRAHS